MGSALAGKAVLDSAIRFIPPWYLSNYAIVELYIVDEFDDSIDVSPHFNEAVVLRKCDFPRTLVASK